MIALEQKLAGIIRPILQSKAVYWIGLLGLAAFTMMASFIALRFWEMPDAMDRMMATNAFFENLGLAGAFLIVAVVDLTFPAQQ